MYRKLKMAEAQKCAQLKSIKTTKFTSSSQKMIKKPWNKFGSSSVQDNHSEFSHDNSFKSL